MVSEHGLKVTLEYCMQFIGRKVVAHHINGHIYRGRLHSVTDDGIYLMRARVISLTSGSTDESPIGHAISHLNEQADIHEAFFPFLFLPLVALTGIAAARPYPYAYGYNPGPWYY